MKNKEIPMFPAWRAELTDADEFGVDPQYITFTLTTKIRKDDTRSGIVDKVLAALREVSNG